MDPKKRAGTDGNSTSDRFWWIIPGIFLGFVSKGGDKLGGGLVEGLRQIRQSPTSDRSQAMLFLQCVFMTKVGGRELMGRSEGGRSAGAGHKVSVLLVCCTESNKM